MLSNLEVELKGKGVVSDATRPPNPLVRAILWLSVSKIFVVADLPVGCCLFHPDAVTGVRRLYWYATLRRSRECVTIRLVGYSLVVGLSGTGDRQQTLFTTQTLANIMQRMGVQIPASRSSLKMLRQCL